MDELERLGREARAELGAPSEAWLTAQRQRLFRDPTAEARPRRSWLVPALAFAALASVALLLGLFASQRHTAPSPQPLALSAAAESKRVPLEDGSAAILTAGSRAVVHSPPGVTRFELLQGSAEFDVVPQQGRSFTVVAGTFEITVVGTRFSVQRGTNGGVAVAVSHGLVSIRGPGREPLRLAAGQRFQSDRGEPKLAAAHEPSELSAPSGVDALPSAGASTPKPASSAAEPSGEAAVVADWEAAYRERHYAVAVTRAKDHGLERLLGTLSAQKLAALADAARLGGDAELALRALQTIERRFPGSPQAADAEFLIGRLHASRGDSAGALVRLEKYLQRGDRAPYAVEATGRLVELYAARGDTERAQRMAKRYLERAPDGPYRRLCLSVLQKP